MATTVRRDTTTLPAAELGPENPLPPLKPLDAAHGLDDKDLEGLPRDMARQLTYEPLRSVLPARVRDGYGRERTPTSFDTLVIENTRLRVTVLPGLGGRIHSLFHKPTGRELLYRNPVFQPADFALNGAWYSGGIEWNIGATGHTALSCAPLHAARLTAPDGGEMVRLWEWERLRDIPFQVDLWLPEDSDFLHVGVRIRNPHERPVPVYWWSNIAVPEERRVLAPADEAWHYGYARTLRKVPVPEHDGVDRTRPPRAEFPADYFYDVPDGARRWIAALDEDGHGLAQTSTPTLRGRKLFVWGTGTGGRRWQRWLTEPGTGGYAEIQAGLARTQLEHVRLDAESEFAWLESYGPLTADPDVVHGADWAAARGEAQARLAQALPAAAVDAAYDQWRPRADAEPEETLAVGSGWGALEVLRGQYKLPGSPSRRPRSAPNRSRGWNCCTAGPCRSPGRSGRPGPPWSPRTGGTCWRPRPRGRTPSTTSASPSGTPGTWPRRCAAGSAAWNSPRPAGRCCAASPSPTRSPAMWSAPPTGTPRPSTTCAPSVATTAWCGPRRPPPSAGRSSAPWWPRGARRRRGASGTACTRTRARRADSG